MSFSAIAANPAVQNAAISIGSKVLGGVVGKIFGGKKKKADFSDMARLEKNRYKWTVAGAQAAGFNPAFVLGATGGNQLNVPQASADDLDIGSMAASAALFGVSDYFANAQNRELTDAQIALTKAQTASLEDEIRRAGIAQTRAGPTGSTVRDVSVTPPESAPSVLGTIGVHTLANGGEETWDTSQADPSATVTHAGSVMKTYSLPGGKVVSVPVADFEMGEFLTGVGLLAAEKIENAYNTGQTLTRLVGVGSPFSSESMARDQAGRIAKHRKSLSVKKTPAKREQTRAWMENTYPTVFD